MATIKKTIKDTFRENKKRYAKQINIKTKDMDYKNEDTKTKAQYYAQTAWKKLRAYKLQQQPLCQLCLQRGIVKPATDCHHAIKFFDQYTPDLRQTLLLDYDNLVSLCEDCHNKVHKKPDMVWPEQRRYLDNIKNNVSQKYYDQGILIRWTNDRHKNIKKSKFY